MPSIADLLRREIQRSGETISAIARATGILQPPLWRFVNEKSDLMLGSIEKLLDYFGYEVVKKASRRPATPRLAKGAATTTKPRRRRA
jgi:hypothetical protein